jgi:predicted RNA-binding Zn ribbon-like protein
MPMFPSDVGGPDEGARPVSLEFANTMRWHASRHPQETLRSYPDLVSWIRKAELATDREARRLMGQAQADPEAADRALKRARRLREAIYGIFTAVIERRPVRAKDLEALNEVIVKLEQGARIEHTRSGFIWAWNTDEDELDSFLGRIALSAANLLLSDRHRWVGQCADDRGCGWLFLDTSKNHSRRWCDMNDCGNRAKQRRLKERQRRPA